jgi:hypothetical protein
MEKELKPKATRKKTPKPELSAYELIYAEFQSDLNDKELQERYDRFKRTREAAKERHNKIIPEINDLIAQRTKVRDLIVDLAVSGIDTTDAVRKFKDLEEKILELANVIEKEKTIMAEEDALIKKYEEGSEKKFFHYWKTFKALDKNTPSWLDWYHKQYKGMII